VLLCCACLYFTCMLHSSSSIHLQTSTAKPPILQAMPDARHKKQLDSWSVKHHKQTRYHYGTAQTNQSLCQLENRVQQFVKTTTVNR
jgi:hypothetical protein